MSRGEKRRDLTSLIKTPRQIVPKPVLGVELKLEVAKAPQEQRRNYLETAYVLEEMLYSVENGLWKLPPPGFQLVQKQKVINRVFEQKQRKEEDEETQKLNDKKRLEQRKKILKDQLDKMKVKKDAK